MLDAIADPALLGSILSSSSCRAWVCCAAALFGLTTTLSATDRAFIAGCLGHDALPTTPAREAWLVIGRRGGKSWFAALVAVFLACFRDYQHNLTPGERGVLMVLASDRHQAGVVHGYIAGLLHRVPMLEALILRETREAIDLTTGVTIEIHTASFRHIRGYTVVAAICDEIAFWRTDDSANPDTEILHALRPAMATVPGALLLCISSPYARRGELWKAYRTHFGQESHVLVWRADTRTMNPTVPPDLIDQAYRDDPLVAAAEYGAEFRRDLDTLIAREVLDAAVSPGRRELRPVGHVRYSAFVDPSGGSRDSMTLAIAHREGDTAVLDLLREVRPPFSPETVVREFAAALRPYRIATVYGDRYGGEWPREQFRRQGVDYQIARWCKSDLYRELLPLLNSGHAALLDHPRTVMQLSTLERRTARGGRDSIDHPPGSHDDLANAAAGALVEAAQGREPGDYGVTP